VGARARIKSRHSETEIKSRFMYLLNISTKMKVKRWRNAEEFTPSFKAMGAAGQGIQHFRGF
jgi:hypothetical protein